MHYIDISILQDNVSKNLLNIICKPSCLSELIPCDSTLGGGGGGSIGSGAIGGSSASGAGTVLGGALGIGSAAGCSGADLPRVTGGGISSFLIGLPALACFSRSLSVFKPRPNL